MAANVSFHKNDNKRVNDAKNLDIIKNKCCRAFKSLLWLIFISEQPILIRQEWLETFRLIKITKRQKEKDW
jgi:hypothetical protein